MKKGLIHYLVHRNRSSIFVSLVPHADPNFEHEVTMLNHTHFLYQTTPTYWPDQLKIACYTGLVSCNVAKP